MRSLLTLLLLFLFNVALTAQSYYFPPLEGEEWENIAPEELGWCQSELDELLSFLEEKNTKSFIILKDGKIVVEAYFGDYNANSIWYWASAGKSLMATIIGLAQQDGDLNINNPTSDYLGEGWTSTTPAQEEKIKLIHQISMTTGLDENYNSGLGLDDCLDPACLQYGFDPGTHWYYYNSPYRLTQDVVEAATGENLSLYTRARLGDRIGMKGFWLNYIYWSKARDMARFGLFILNQGTWNTDTVLSDMDYFQAMTTPSQSLNPSYGYLWWLNGQESFKLPTLNLSFPGSLIPAAPTDMIAAMGKNDQRVYVVPSKDLVVIRQGEAAEEALAGPSSFDNQLWGLIENLGCVTATTESRDGNLKIYPNPASTFLFVENMDQSSNQLELILYDLLGQPVLQQRILDQQSISIDGLARGAYFYRILAEDRLVRKGKVILN